MGCLIIPCPHLGVSFLLLSVDVLVLIASLFVMCLVSCVLNLFLSLLSYFSRLVFVLCFLTVVDAPLYGRWIAHVDTLCLLAGGRGGFQGMKCVASFTFFLFFVNLL